MCHVQRFGALGILGALLTSGAARAQVLAIPLPAFGYGSSPAPYGLFGPSYYPPGLTYGLGFRGAFFGYGSGANAYAAQSALYNPQRFNAAFAPQMYNPTPQAYNPALYNASFNPALAQAYAAAYAKAGPAGKPEQATAQAPADKTIRPVALDAAPELASIRMKLPTADATVALQGKIMKQPGKDRLFFTPPLERGSKYSYDVVVRWRDAGGEQSRTRHVSIRAGQNLQLDFTGKESR